MTRAIARYPAMDFAFNVASQGARSALPARGAMLACTNLPPTANAVKPSCRYEYAPVHLSVCPIGESSASPDVPVEPATSLEPAARGLDRRLLPPGRSAI